MNVTVYGERHGQHKLTLEQVSIIRASGEGATALGRRYGVNKRTIDRVRNREAWGRVK